MSEQPPFPSLPAEDLFRFGLINEVSIAAARSQTMQFLGEHPGLTETLQQCTFASRAMGDLYPETVETLFSGHAFPVMQAQQELETSIQLALVGLYTYSFVALRTVLELELLGVFFAVDDSAHTEIQAWLRSQERTPAMARMLSRIFEIPALEKVDREAGLRQRIRVTYDELGGYVHTRGYRFSASGLNRTNVNQFNESAFRVYVDDAREVIGLSAAVLVGKYLIGLQSLPLDEKFGLNAPAGGLLDSGTHWLRKVIDGDLLEPLQKLSDEDPETQAIVEWVESLPDLTQEQLNEQAEWWDREWGAHRLSSNDEQRP